MNIFRITLIIVLTTISFQNVNAQASYSVVLAFQLLDENGERVDFETFCKEYEIANTFGNNIKVCDETANQSFVTFDKKTNYFVLEIHTIGPRFSFALYHNNKVMTIFIPFTAQGTQNALRFLQFDEGDYVVDLIRTKETIKFDRYVAPIQVVKENNWIKQRHKFLMSEYKGQEDIYRNKLKGN
ncbi:hypothetical protein [Flavobacterium pallidum]|uniref:Uncharacterized protein n=1 Tax=Flavobacterium pallidum TaxID=2172098 RepID=A0A2S1SKE7_9FLAO|nr:hypothetical protein [Flavobacterium pallidum]AWI26843.1 hypothetical protein HYN49_13560 [Flavobacterium pallidum]AWI26859.1 hypothetical protein HYN49_13640 [Flavobacterium pallidum]